MYTNKYICYYTSINILTNNIRNKSEYKIVSIRGIYKKKKGNRKKLFI